MSELRQDIIDEATQLTHALPLLGRRITALQHEYTEIMRAIDAVYSLMTPAEYAAFLAQYKHARHP